MESHTGNFIVYFVKGLRTITCRGGKRDGDVTKQLSVESSESYVYLWYQYHH